MRNIVTFLYADYGRYIDSFRAIPKEIDCLKPVERRLLLSVHQVARGKFQKSAKVIGTCIGNYHPHGDCLDGNTKVYCLDGSIKTFKEIYESKIPNLEVLGVDKDNNIIPITAHSFRIGQYTTKIYNIELLDGSVIKTTNNHKFNTLTRGWVKAEDLDLTDRLASIRCIENNSYIELRNYKYLKLLHELVYAYHNNTKYEIIHHIDEDKYNNSPSNLKGITRSEHAKLHNGEANINGLEKGRHSMFCENGKYRSQTREKNKRLMQEYNKNQGIFKAIQVLKNKNINLTEPNYNKYRTIVYNAPFINRMITKRQIASFTDLLLLINTFKINTANAKNLFIKNKKPKSNKNSKLINCLTANTTSKLIEIIGLMQSLYQDVDFIHYNSCRDMLIKKNGSGFGNIQGRSYPTIDKIKNIDGNLKNVAKSLPISSQIIKSINIEILKEEVPMYDFTVDNYENMFIVGNIFDNGVSLINVHNSSTYDSLTNLVQRKFVEGQGNWGRHGLEPSRAAAYRYTECKANDALHSIFSDYLDFVPWEPLELEDEPLYIPFPVPLGLIGSGITTGIGFHTTKIPRYSFKDLVIRLVDILEHKNPKTVIKPIIDDCKIIENEVGAFEKILTHGEGVIQVVPDYTLSATDLVINGRNPIIGFTSLKKLNETNETLTGDPLFNAIDAWDYKCKSSIRIIITSATRSRLLHKDVVAKVVKSISSLVHINVNVIDEKTNTVIKKSIDNILIDNYEKWKGAILKFYKNQLSNNLIKLQEFNIILVVRKILEQNPNVKTIDEILKLNTSTYNNTEVKRVCTKYSIKNLIEGHIDIAQIQTKINGLNKTINGIDNFVLSELKHRFLK